jgi:hypothetical protein
MKKPRCPQAPGFPLLGNQLGNERVDEEDWRYLEKDKEMRTHFPTFALAAALLGSSMAFAHAAGAGGGGAAGGAGTSAGTTSAPSSQAVGPAPVQGLPNPSTDAVTAVRPGGSRIGASTNPATTNVGIPDQGRSTCGATGGCNPSVGGRQTPEPEGLELGNGTVR